MKDSIYRILSGFKKAKWGDNKLVRVLIETNKYFNKDLWNTTLICNENYNLLDIRYFSNKYEGYKLVKDTQVMFSFGENAYYDKRNIKLQYYGVSQPLVSRNSTYITFYAKGFSSRSIAEYCLTYSLLLMNDCNKYIKNQTAKIWKQAEFVKSATTIATKKIGILGLGNNGSEVSELFRKIGCRVYGYDIKKDNASVVDVFCESLSDLIIEADILIVAVNSTTENANLINSKTLSLMKESSYLINVSRGEILNEEDLYKVLKEKRIGGAVLDVTSREPLSRYNKLWNLNNLIITPHISGNVNKYCKEVMTDFSEKLNYYVDKMHV